MVFVIGASIVADSRQGFVRLCFRKQLAKGYVSDLTPDAGQRICGFSQPRLAMEQIAQAMHSSIEI